MSRRTRPTHQRSPEPSRSHDEALISSRDMDRLRDSMGSAHDYIRSSGDPRRGGSSGMKTAAMGLAEVGGGLLLNAFLSSRYENVFHPGGTRIPLDLVGGLVGLYAAHTGIAGKHSGDLARLSAGVALGYLFKLGAGFGTSQRAAQNLPPIAITAGCHCAPGTIGCNCHGKAPPQLAPGAAAPPARALTEAEMAAYSRSY